MFQNSFSSFFRRKKLFHEFYYNNVEKNLSGTLFPPTSKKALSNENIKILQVTSRRIRDEKITRITSDDKKCMYKATKKGNALASLRSDIFYAPSFGYIKNIKRRRRLFHKIFFLSWYWWQVKMFFREQTSKV